MQPDLYYNVSSYPAAAHGNQTLLEKNLKLKEAKSIINLPSFGIKKKSMQLPPHAEQIISPLVHSAAMSKITLVLMLLSTFG